MEFLDGVTTCGAGPTYALDGRPEQREGNVTA